MGSLAKPGLHYSIVNVPGQPEYALHQGEVSEISGWLTSATSPTSVHAQARPSRCMPHYHACMQS